MWFGIHKPIPARKFCFYHKISVLKILNHALTNQTPHSYQWGVNYIAKEVSITLFIHLLIHSFIYDRSFQWYQVVIFDVKLVIFWISFRSGPKMRFILSPAFVYRIYFVPQNKSNWCSKNRIYFGCHILKVDLTICNFLECQIPFVQVHKVTKWQRIETLSCPFKKGQMLKSFGKDLKSPGF